MGMEIDIVVFDKKKINSNLLHSKEGEGGQMQYWIDYHDACDLVEDQLSSMRRNYELRDALNTATGVRAQLDYTLVNKQNMLAARELLYLRAKEILEAQMREANIHFVHTTKAIDIWQGIAAIEKVLREVNLEDMYVGYHWS